MQELSNEGDGDGDYRSAAAQQPEGHAGNGEWPAADGCILADIVERRFGAKDGAHGEDQTDKYQHQRDRERAEHQAGNGPAGKLSGRGPVFEEGRWGLGGNG